jgi:hypothetical protein
MNVNEARALLEASGMFFDPDPECLTLGSLYLNLNDAFGWACADAEKVEDHELIEVARLFRDYGWCGLLYWASEKRCGARTSFEDNNRFIEFVRHEERVRREVPDSGRRASHRVHYTVGVAPRTWWWQKEYED